MVKKKKKKGSSLLITVAMFAILSILTMSVLAMTTSGYSMRIKSNKRIENFYAADSGLEIAQKVLHDYLGRVVEFSLHEANNKEKHDERELVFKNKFKEFIIDGGKKTDKNGIEISPVEEIEKVEFIIEKESNYTSFQRDGKTVKIESNLKAYKKDGNEFALPDLVKKYEDINKFILNVKSNFIDRENKEREVSVDFEIIIPEYGEVLIRAKSSKVPNILNYIVGVDGDYTIDGTGSINVIGDMWVKGNKPLNLTKENKYNGGITIQSSQQDTEFSWKGNIATASTLKIDNTILKVEKSKGNLPEYPDKEDEYYDQNVYAGNLLINNNQSSTKNYFGSDTNLFVYNDFVMNGTEALTKIKNYYGLNDVNNVEGIFGNTNYGKHLDTSSSIIINGVNNEKEYLNISKDAYILGASYLDLGDAYQTGQSTVVNQLTRPYTERSDEYIYEYKGTMHIATKDLESGEGLDIPEKAKMVKEYYDNNVNVDEEKLANGFKIGGDLYNTGAVLAKVKENSNSNIHMPNNQGIANKTKFIKDKKNQYVQEVFYMGEKGNYNEKDFWNNKVGETVEKSFDWVNMSKLAKTFNSNSKIDRLDSDKDKVEEERTSGLIHLQPKMIVNKIIERAHNDASTSANKELHPVGTYKPTLSESEKPQIIINSSNKSIEIRKGTENKIKEENNNLIYETNIGKQPLLVISKGDIIYNDLNDVNYNMLISAGSVIQNVSPAGNVGNFSVSSEANKINYPVGEMKFVNELFKYILEDFDIMGEIGGDIFHGSEEKVATNAIEISKLIKTKNWKLNK